MYHGLQFTVNCKHAKTETLRVFAASIYSRKESLIFKPNHQAPPVLQLTLRGGFCTTPQQKQKLQIYRSVCFGLSFAAIFKTLLYCWASLLR